MKKIMVGLAMALSLVAFVPNTSNATSGISKKDKVEVTAAQAERTKVITARLYEIKAMDKSNMTVSEKKALRKEVKAMKKEAREMSGGIYLSIGAVIIIILLLIILL